MTEPEAKRGRGRPPKIEPESTIFIHFLKDGVCAFGNIWMAGQELELERDSDEFRSSLDRNGKSWLDFTDKDQKTVWGEIRFGRGESPIPNPYLDYWESFDPDQRTYRKGEFLDRTMLEMEAQKERARGRSIPKGPDSALISALSQTY